MPPLGNRDDFTPGTRVRPGLPAVPQVPPPVVPPPTAPPPGTKPVTGGGLRTKPPARPPGTPPPGGPVRPGNRAPDPAKDPLPPQFKRMLDSGMPEAQVRQKWARSLQLRGKIGPNIPGAPKPTPTTGPPVTTPPPGGTTAPPPAPGTPINPTPPPGTGGGPGGGGPGGGGAQFPPPPGMGGGSPLVQPGNAAPTDFRDPMMQFLSMVPLMNLNAQHRINDAVSSAGFTGNRWGTSTANDVARIGAETGMQQNALMQNLLADYANKQEDRALTGTGMGMQLGGLLDQMAQDRVRLPMEAGQWEQGRMDDFAKFAYGDFEANKLGWLPMLLDAAKSQGAGSPGQIYTTTEPGKPGAVDWLQILKGFFS